VKPCDECPWSKAVKSGALGGSHPDVYVGQVVGPFWLPCHMSKNYAGKMSDVNDTQDCRGAATFRANIKVKPAKGLLELPPDNGETCFSSLAEFYAHHRGITVEAAKAILTDERVCELAVKALTDANVKMQKRYHKERRKQG